MAPDAHDPDSIETDPWGPVEEVPEWDPLPEVDATPLDLEGPSETPPTADPSVAGRRRGPFALFRAHRTAILVAVCWVVVALLMLAGRHSVEAHPSPPAGVGETHGLHSVHHRER